MVADRVVAGSVYSLDRQQRSWLRCGSLRGQACDSGPGFLESGSDAAVSVGVDADMGRAASCFQSSRSSGGLAMHVAACCGEGACFLFATVMAFHGWPRFARDSMSRRGRDERRGSST